MSRVQRGQARDSEPHGVSMQNGVIPYRRILNGSGVNNISDLFIIHKGFNLIALRRVTNTGYGYSQSRDSIGRTLRGIEAHTEIGKPFCKKYALLIVALLYADEYAGPGFTAQRGKRKICRAKTLEQGFGLGFADSENFPGRFHLRPKDRVCVVQLFK